MANSCESILYWIGSTTERFTVSTDINTTTDLTVTPNDGGSGTILDFNWVVDNFNTVNRFLFTGTKLHNINIPSGDVHALIIYPEFLNISTVIESVLGLDVELELNVHYGIFSIYKGAEEFKCLYFRDLSNISFNDRVFQFDISL